MTAPTSSHFLRRNGRKIAILTAIPFVFIIIWSLGGNDPARKQVAAWTRPSNHASNAGHDGFANFHRTPECNISTADLYRPANDPCNTRQELLSAMSDGGRIGFDAPYQTRDCDMRWYDNKEICSILSRFDGIHLVGDSMVRHVASAIVTILREDLPNGARTTWKQGNPPEKDCHCREQYKGFTCWAHGFTVTGTEDVWANDPGSIKCNERSTATIDFQWTAKDPASEVELGALKRSVKGKRRLLFSVIYETGYPAYTLHPQGVWENFDLIPTQRWISDFEGVFADMYPKYRRPDPVSRPPEDTAAIPSISDSAPTTDTGVQQTAAALDTTEEAAAVDNLGTIPAPAPGPQPDMTKARNKPRPKHARAPRNRSNDTPPRLFLPPSAQGMKKGVKWIGSQSNIKLMNYERDLDAWLSDRGWETLGTFNLTLQSVSHDGLHATMESNLVKAMMVLNWLDWVGREVYS